MMRDVLSCSINPRDERRVGLLGLIMVALLLLGGVRAQAADDNAAALVQRLFDAIQSNDLQAVQASVAAGANLDARDRWGMSPIELAIDKGYFSIAHFLTSARNYRRQTASPASRSTPPATTEGTPPALTTPPLHGTPAGAGKKALKSSASRPASRNGTSTPRA